jgi:hypothetical protein
LACPRESEIAHRVFFSLLFSPALQPVSHPVPRDLLSLLVPTTLAPRHRDAGNPIGQTARAPTTTRCDELAQLGREPPTIARCAIFFSFSFAFPPISEPHALFPAPSFIGKPDRHHAQDGGATGISSPALTRPQAVQSPRNRHADAADP